MDLSAAIKSLGELAATHELYALGFTQARLRRASRDGEIVRVRKGWFGRPALPLALMQAARVGGRLASVSAARWYGLWVPSDDGTLHVQVPPNACQLRTREDYRHRLSESEGLPVTVHWEAPRTTASRVIVSVAEAVEQIIGTKDDEFGFVVCESAIEQRALTHKQLEAMSDRLPVRIRYLPAITALSGSGTESIFSFRMRQLGIRFRQQVQLGPDRVDFLIGERLVVEIDSSLHDPVRDRRRDARLSILGYRVLRFDYHQVINDWAMVEAVVLAAISRGDHLAA